MPRKKQIEKFKYTVRKKDKNGTPLDLYVVLPVPGLKYPVWRICRDESQEGADAVIAQIRASIQEQAKESEIPQSSAGEFFDFWLNLTKPRISQRTLENYRNNVERYLRPAI